MIHLSLFTESDDICIAEYVLMSVIAALVCKYQKHTEILYVCVCVCMYSVITLIRGSYWWLTLCQIYFVTIRRPLLSAFVFQWRIKHASVCLCIFLFMCLLMAPSPESIWFIAWPSFLFPFFPPSLSLFKYPDFFDALFLYFSLPLNISRCRNANMKLWTSGTIEQRPELLSAFMAEGNISAPLLYCHWVHLFVFSLLSTQNLYKFTLKHLFTGQNPSHIHPVFF